MELKKGDYVLGYWFAADEEDNCWYMMIIKRDNEWLGQYTFRYNKEPKGKFDPFAGVDEKSIYQLRAPGENSEEEMLTNIEKLFNFIRFKYSTFSDHFLIRGDISKFMEIAKTKHYLHLKQVQ